MRADAARGLQRPLVRRLIAKAARLHPVILASTRRVEEIHRRIDVAGGGKQVQLLRLLAREGEPANIARGTERKKVKRNRRAAKEHVLIVAVPECKAGAAQLYGI